MMDKKELLRRRALQLSKIPKTEMEKRDGLEIVIFHLGMEKYALETQFLKEVYPYKELTPVPCVPDYIYGLINVRRRIVTVVDLRALFELPRKDASSSGKALILEKDSRECGIDVDYIIGMHMVRPDEIESPLPSSTAMHRRFTKGITEDATILLDGWALLSDEKLTVEDFVN